MVRTHTPEYVAMAFSWMSACNSLALALLVSHVLSDFLAYTVTSVAILTALYNLFVTYNLWRRL